MSALNVPAALKIARKDIKILLKERGTLLYLFVVPLVFILAFGGAFGRQSDPEEETIPLPVVNLDAGSEASGMLLGALDQGGGIQCELYDEARARAGLYKGDINRVLTIPASYAEHLGAGRPVTLRLVNHADANPARSEAVYRAVTGVAADLSLETQLIASFRQMADMEAAASPEQQAFTAEVMIEQAQRQFARSRTEPLLAVNERWPVNLLEDEDDINPLSVLVPGFAVLFIFLTAQTTAMSIYEEKTSGSFRRLLAAPISKVTILGGKMTPNFVTGLAQTVVLFGVAVFVFPVLGFDRISLGNDPLALILVCLTVLLCSTGLGLLIAAIARTEGQISGVSQVVLWGFGFVGILFAQGPSVPPFDTISQAMPHYWANAALTDLLVRGHALADVMPSILPLLGFTAAFLVVGLWRFEFD